MYGDIAVVDAKGHPVGPVGIVDLDSQNYFNFTVHTCENMLPWEAGRWPLMQTLCRDIPAPSASPAPAPPASAAPAPTSTP